MSWRPQKRHIVGAVGAVCATAIIAVAATQRADARCDDIHALIDASRGATTASSDFRFDDAKRCDSFVDVEASTLICDWDFASGSADARVQVDELLATVRSCVGEGVDEQVDQLVNHPDYYESVYFRLADSVLSVSLKNKNAQQRTYVSISVEHDV